MYTCKYFKPYELVPKDVYDKIHNDNLIYKLFDENLLKIIDMIREWAGVGLIINNWYWGGSRSQCGFRPSNSTVGVIGSAHKLGKAVDIISTKINTKQLWDLIDKNEDKLPCKVRIERTNNGAPITWLHIDTNASSTQTKKIYYFNA